MRVTLLMSNGGLTQGKGQQLEWFCPDPIQFCYPSVREARNLRVSDASARNSFTEFAGKLVGMSESAIRLETIFRLKGLRFLAATTHQS